MKKNIVVMAIVGTIIALVFCLMAYAMAEAKSAYNFALNFQYGVGGGDCSADRASGDLYHIPDGYCVGSEGSPVAEILVEIAIPTVTPTPTAIPTQIQPTNVVEKDEEEDKPVVVQEPEDKKPELPPQEPPAKDPPAEVPEPKQEKECKNPNQYKEGTSDCNAGGGND